jgi:hypothetical protein
MSFRQVYMVSHASSFNLVSAMQYYQYIRVGAIAFIWSLWLYRNEEVFNDKNSSILQVIYRAIGTLCLWSSLQWLEDRDLFMEVYARLEATTRDTFSQHGWPHSLRICAPV